MAEYLLTAETLFALALQSELGTSFLLPDIIVLRGDNFDLLVIGLTANTSSRLERLSKQKESLALCPINDGLGSSLALRLVNGSGSSLSKVLLEPLMSLQVKSLLSLQATFLG